MTCAVAHCGVSGNLRRHDGLHLCVFHLAWYSTRYHRRPTQDHHAGLRRGALMDMAPYIVDGTDTIPTWRLA